MNNGQWGNCMYDVENILYWNCDINMSATTGMQKNKLLILPCELDIRTHHLWCARQTALLTNYKWPVSPAEMKVETPWEEFIRRWLPAGSAVHIALTCQEWSNIDCFVLFTCVMDFAQILSCARQTCLVWYDSVTTMVDWKELGFHTNLLLACKTVSAPCSYFCYWESN